MSSNAFTVTGEALLGDRWAPVVGQALNLNEKTAPIWMIDAGSIPESLWREILKLIGERHLALVVTRDAIETHPETLRANTTQEQEQ